MLQLCIILSNLHTLSLRFRASKEKIMSNEFCIGIILGMIGGALLINNSKKAKEMLDEGQQKIVKKLNNKQEKPND